MTFDPDTAPHRCQYCGEIETSAHVFCRPSNIPKPPAQPTWSAVKREDDPDVRHEAAIAEVRQALAELRDLAEYFAKQDPNTYLELQSDHRVRRPAVTWLGDLARALRDVLQRRTVAKGG